MPNMSRCATRKSQEPIGCALLGTITAGYPTQIMAVNFFGPLPESNSGNSYIMVVGDYFTRWIEALPIPNQETHRQWQFSWWMNCSYDTQCQNSYTR